ncbi:MAG: class I SAM-dependent methyltransferase [Hyphomicrobiales bacterium]|nr:class I SAM-dependent methyltransferase [Hyphomicrobiales bacterium]
MTRVSYGLDETIRTYLLANQPAEHPLLAELREATASIGRSRMQISPEQGHFLAFLIKLIGARAVLEVGTFTGYSSLAMALALPADGRILALDNSAEWTDTARRYWQRGGVAERIELRLGAAVDTLRALADEGYGERFDFVFIDANKEDYDAYYELSLPLTRRGGLIAIDNALRDGRVADPDETRLSVTAVRDLNAKIARDERVDRVLLPVGDGMMMARRR